MTRVRVIRTYVVSYVNRHSTTVWQHTVTGENMATVRRIWREEHPQMRIVHIKRAEG